MAEIKAHVSQIVVETPASTVPPTASSVYRGPIPIALPQELAPVWFYSALNWLGKSYYDANNGAQSFNAYVGGSDVDPYAELGSTRLFMIFRTENLFRLTLAADVSSTAPLTGGTRYPNSDAGIRQMYLDLAASPIFSALKYCYIPGRPALNIPGAEINGFQSGYDPATGIRLAVGGSAVAQIVPLDDFLKTRNEQIYDEHPTIVPIVTALVYDITRFNELGATTFLLPVFYTRDSISGNTYVSRQGSIVPLGDRTSACGQTVVFPGGPGYTDAAATPLKLNTTAFVANNGVTFTTYRFDTATVNTIATLSPKVQTGIVSVTYTGTSPAAVFAEQRIIGFYRDATWTTCLGVPIYDFGTNNAAFTNATAPLAAPTLVYGTTDEFLNGGALQNVLLKLTQATYVRSTDELVAMLDGAIAVKDASAGAGLAVMTAALDFNMSSTPAAPAVDQLAVPVLATVTTTPPPVVIPTPLRDRAGTIASNGVVRAIAGLTLQNIGTGGNTPTQTQPGPVTVQVPLGAFVPKEALGPTGITSIEIGTKFPVQNLGSGTAFQAAAGGTTVNLMVGSKPAFAPYALPLGEVAVTLRARITYVFSLTGTALTVRGSDGSSSSSTIPASGAGATGGPDPNHTYVGAAVYAPGITTVSLYPLLSLAFPAPSVGTHGVLQGEPYGVRLTFGATTSQYDIIDEIQTIVDADISVPSPKPVDNSSPQPGDLYFGSFIGGASSVTVWAVPVFVTLVPSQLSGAAFNGTMTVGAQVSGLPGYQLAITDSSLFVYSNINVDNGAIGSVSPANVFLASAIINSSPDDLTAKAFAPCRLLMGLIRQVQMGLSLKYVFVPEDDSVVIGGVRYMLSVVNLEAMEDDPNARPYPPVFWPQTRYWQFANRHDPYIDVGYAGDTETQRLARAKADVERIGRATAAAREPMQMYLDTNRDEMMVWPIYAFPYATSTQTVDQGQLKAITSAILQLLNTTLAAAPPAGTPAPLGAEQVALPDELQQANPYTAGTGATVAAGVATNAIVMDVATPTLTGVPVTNLSPTFIANASLEGIAAHQSADVLQAQRAAAELAVTKSMQAQTQVVQARTAGTETPQTTEARRFSPLYGFSVYNPATGEAYIVEVVDADLAIPDQLPKPTQNATYDPFYVRVAVVNTLTCYNMSIIVPSMARDQYGNFAHLGTAYRNVLSETNELKLGYLYSLADAAGNFDDITLTPYGYSDRAAISASASYVFTNLPYGRLPQARMDRPPAYFACRRRNWDAECHLMQSTHPAGSAVYLAFGGGDLVPFRLDAPFSVDKRQPAHMYELSYSFGDRLYDSAETLSVGNTPYVVGVTTLGGIVDYTNFSINSTAGTTGVQTSSTQSLDFPPEIYVVGQASTTFTSMADINAQLGTFFGTTGAFSNRDAQGNVIAQQYQLIAYNNLVYLIRAVSNVPELGLVGGVGAVSGLLVDTYVPATTGNLVLAQAARYKHSGLQYFGSTYTPTTMVDTLDQLDFTSITGEPFFAPTLFIPIAELDSTKGFVANLSNFLGQQFWTFIYPEIVAQSGATVNGVSYPNGYNIDPDGKSILSLQKLHFVYDPLAVMFTPNDLSHKYALQPKQQVLALTNDQIREAICWRSANVQPQRLPPQNISAQQILPAGDGMDRTNIIYSHHNRPVLTAAGPGYLGMSVNSFVSVSGVTYNIEESALSGDQTGSGFISAVSSNANMLVGVLFDYDNSELGTLSPYDSTQSTKGVAFINGYLSAGGFAFSSPDHFDVNDVLPSQVPLLDEIAQILGNDVAFNDIDASLPRQFWSLTYDTFTAPGVPNYIANAPPSPVDPTFSNRTRSLILNLQNPVRPNQLGIIDTYSSVVSANLHLQNGVTGAIFLSKKADRDIASIGSTPSGSATLYGLPTKYDFFIFSRDHYWTLKDASFELIDNGYAMCLVDDGTGTGTKIAQYSIDADGNYFELYTYVLYSPNGGVIETGTFPLKVTLGTPANLSASPVVPEMPNSVNPSDLVAQINKASNLIYAAFGPSSPGQPPAYLPIQAVGGEVQAAPIVGPPGFGGYNLNVVGANRQPVQISQIYSGNVTYAIAGSTTVVPISPKSGKAVPFYGSLSHGLDKQVSVPLLQSRDLTSFIPRTTVPPGPAAGIYGGDGLGSLIGTPFSCAFQGSGAIPPAVAGNPTPGTIMKADDSVFYTFNAVTNGVLDSTGKSASASGAQYFVDATDPANPIYGVVALPKFTFNGNTYNVNLNTTAADGTSRYTLVVGGKSYLFGPDNAHVTVDRTTFTFSPLTGGVYTVTFTALDAPAVSEAPTPISLTPFSIAAGGLIATLDVFTDPGSLKDILLGPSGRLYTYDPVAGQVTIAQGPTTTTAPLATGLAFVSNSGYGYVIGFESGGSATGTYTVNGSLMFPYAASTSGAPASYPLLTAPQMFTVGGNAYTFNQDQNGNYLSVTGNGQTYPVNPYQFSILGVVYIINTNVQPNTVVGGGNVYAMTAANTQFVLNGVQYTIALKGGSLNGATISGQYDITQGNVVVVENYAYELDIPNGQIVGNGTAYPLTTSGFTYTITTANQSFTVTTEPNAATVTIANIVYRIDSTTVVADGVIYPILPYRTFVDGAATYNIGIDGTADLPQPFTLTGQTPWTRATFTDGVTYTVNDLAAFDGSNYFLISGTPAQFTAAARTYQLRTDGVSIAAGPEKTYIAPSGAPSPNQFTFGTQTLYFGRPTDVAAFDGTHYYAIANGAFTDTNTARTYTLSGNTAVHEGNSYEIYSNLGQGPYFEVPGGPTYYVNVGVADTGTPTGTIYNVFPTSGSTFTIPLQYTITVAGSTVTVNASTFPAATGVPTLTAAGGKLTGGNFQDPFTKIVYTCVVDAGTITFVDSNNAVYPYPAPGTTDVFTASVVVTTGVNLAVDNEAPPQIFPIFNNQFAVGTTTYTVNVPVAYQNAASGPYWPMVNGRFVVPKTAPLSNVAYTVRGASVIKGYVISNDDQFSPDGNVVYVVNAVNVVKATNQATLSGAEPNQTLTAGGTTYALNGTTSLATTQPAAVVYNTATKQFSVAYNGSPVIYTVGATSVTDNRHPAGTFPATVAGTQVTFTDPVTGVTFTFDNSGNNPITAEFPYANHFFVDVIAETTYYIDEADKLVEVLSYLPETTQYAFTAGDGNTYLIHYNDVAVVFPIVAGTNVNVGVTTVGSDVFTVEVDVVEPVAGGPAIPVNRNSFEINGNRYTITGTPAGANYSSCQVVGAGIAPKPFISPNTFKLSDPNVTYALQLDAANLPEAVTATFLVQPSRDLISVNDNVYLITYATVSTGWLLGQGQASIPIASASFTLTNPFDATKAKFIFDDQNIFDAGSVVGQFIAYTMPTFFLGNATYTLDPVKLVVVDNNKRPYPLLPNPLMFSINGFNYVIDTNHVPHAVIGNNNVSPLSTDVTVQGGHPLPNSTFTLNGQIYAYVEDAQQNLLAIVGTKSYPIAQPGLTFKLDSSLVFTLKMTAPAAGNYPGTVVPNGTVTAGTLVINVYPGIPESGNADFFTYKNVLYTFVKSGSVYVAVQKSYTVYAASPTATQQQLAIFNLNGTTYLVTDGTTTGAGAPAGINPGTLWARTSISTVETQFGVVYGFAGQPTNVSEPTAGAFQFAVANAAGTNTLYDIVYTAGSNANVVKVDVPSLLPTFMQSGPFTFVASNPLTFETGGYNAFTTFVSETATPSESFAGAYKTPIISTDPAVDTLIGPQGDFSVEFWHSLSLTPINAYHPFTYSASTTDPLVYYVDVDFEDGSDIYLQINNSVMWARTTPPIFSSRWRHFGLTYAQPYTIVCRGGGFEVKEASNYNFSRDFSIALTFAASDVTTPQGLAYKGTGSDNSSPQISMSYRVAVNGGAVTLTLTDGTQAISPEFTGLPVLVPGQFYQAIIVKHTTTTATGSSDSPDPYAPPFDLTELGKASNSGVGASASGFPSGGGDITISKVAPANAGATPQLTSFLNNVQNSQKQSYTVAISVRTVNDDGTFGSWQTAYHTQDVSGSPGLTVNGTGSAHLLIGAAYDDSARSIPLGGPAATGNVRDLYLFGSAINPQGISTNGGVVDIADAGTEDLVKAGIVGYWTAQYDPNGLVNNAYDPSAPATSTNTAVANLAPLTGHELEGTTLYVNGYVMPLNLITGSAIPSSMAGYSAGFSLLDFNAGAYRLEEISLWHTTRQAYQVVDDMFGRLVPSNEPFLAVYLSGSFQVAAINAPILPMKQYIDGVNVSNAASANLTFGSASIDLVGSPAVGRCGPLITPNLYTPPGVALTVCDTVPSLTTYSVTLNTHTGTLAGEINEAYVYVKNNVLMLYAGKKVGDLVLTWISQEQGDVQIIGYVEGAPPCPMANLTNKASYAGATSMTLTAPTSVTLKYQRGDDPSDDTKWSIGDNFGITFGWGATVAPFGFGLKTKDDVWSLALTAGGNLSWDSSSGNGTQNTGSIKLDESNKFTIKMEGTLAPYTGDLFMASLNSLTTPSTTAGTPSSKTAILPNPNLGGFTSSNPPGQLPKTLVTDEKFGQRMYIPSPYGQAFVTSQTLDVYQQTLVQSNTVYGFVKVPNAQIPRDLNIVSFRINSKYLRPGCLDGMVGYVYNPATLSSGAQTYTTSTGEMEPLYDQNFSPGVVGHDASYMRVVEAYQIKKQIDQQAYNTLALYQSAYKATENLPDPTLTPSLDFYNEYVWSSRGGTQEVKHTYTTSYDEVYTTTNVTTNVQSATFNVKISTMFITVVDATGGVAHTYKDTLKYTYNTTATSSFDISASFDGIETDTQMRYASNNDAHFVMNYNSMFNPNNQSGLNLVIGSDGLVYQIVPSVTSGAGLPISNNIDTSMTYMQPQPAYVTGNADGLSGNLEPYDRPGKTNLFRSYAFFLQPTSQNADNFWTSVVDPIWLANSPDADADALRSAQGNISIPWRLLYRVTYSERFLPPVATAAIATPQIEPVMAVPVLNPASDFLFQAMNGLPRPAYNPANDIEANIVLAAPTASGLSAGTTPTTGPGAGLPVMPNNVIPFDLVKGVTSIVNWGDSANAKLLTQLLTSVLGLNTVPMSPRALPGSTLVATVADPVSGGTLYAIYADPNGLTVNVPTSFGITVYADLNGNPIQYFDGKTFHSLQADYVSTTDGTVMYYVQPPSTYDQSALDLVGDYDLFGHPGDEWRYYLVSGMSANMTSEPTVGGNGPFRSSNGAGGYAGFTVAPAAHGKGGAKQVQGYVLVQGILQWPSLNTNAETFADVSVYKAMSLLDTFPIGDPEVLISFLRSQYATAPFVKNDEIELVFARNITSYFNTAQQALLPQ